MAKRRPTTTNVASLKDPNEDAFTSAILRLVDWVRENAQTVLIGGVVAVVIAVGAIYVQRSRANELDRAAADFEAVQNAVASGDPAQAIGEVNAYIERFGKTSYADEARILLGQLHLEQGDPTQAIAALESPARDLASDAGVQAALLLGVAYEEAERWSDAIGLYERIRSRAALQFQKDEAGESLVRAHLAAGDTAAAIATLDSLIESLQGDDFARASFEMKAAELRAAQP